MLLFRVDKLAIHSLKRGPRVWIHRAAERSQWFVGEGHPPPPVAGGRSPARAWPAKPAGPLPGARTLPTRRRSQPARGLGQGRCGLTPGGRRGSVGAGGRSRPTSPAEVSAQQRRYEAAGPGLPNRGGIRRLGNARGCRGRPPGASRARGLRKDEDAPMLKERPRYHPMKES